MYVSLTQQQQQQQQHAPNEVLCNLTWSMLLLMHQDRSHKTHVDFSLISEDNSECYDKQYFFF